MSRHETEALAALDRYEKEFTTYSTSAGLRSQGWLDNETWEKHLKHHPEPDCNAKLPSGEPLIVAAARYGDHATQKKYVDYILKAGEEEVDVDATDADGRTALMYAICNENEEVISKLLYTECTFMSDIFLQDRRQENALMLAVSAKKPKILQMLLVELRQHSNDHKYWNEAYPPGKNPIKDLRNIDGCNAIDLARKAGHIQRVQMLEKEMARLFPDAAASSTKFQVIKAKWKSFTALDVIPDEEYEKVKSKGHRQAVNDKSFASMDDSMMKKILSKKQSTKAEKGDHGKVGLSNDDDTFSQSMKPKDVRLVVGKSPAADSAFHFAFDGDQRARSPSGDPLATALAECTNGRTNSRRLSTPARKNSGKGLFRSWPSESST